MARYLEVPVRWEFSPRARELLDREERTGYFPSPSPLWLHASRDPWNKPLFVTTFDLLRLSLVRFAASFLVLLTTGILNRLVITELGVSAILATLLFSLQHFASPLALWTGRISDRATVMGRRRTPFIMAFTIVAAVPVPFLPDLLTSLDRASSVVLAGVSLAVIGFGLKAANLLVSALIVDQVGDAEVRGRQLNMVWVMAIAGFIAGGVVFGWALPEFDPAKALDVDRLRLVATLTAVAVVLVTLVGVTGAETRAAEDLRPFPESVPVGMKTGEVLRRPELRRALVFLALSDLAFFLQEFILEPFGGDVFDLPPSVTTSFNITCGAGMLLSMVAASGLGILQGSFPTRAVLRTANVAGAVAFIALAAASLTSETRPLGASLPVVAIFVLGAAKGLYNTGLSHRFMALASPADAGVVMGAWGAIGGFSMAVGGLLGGVLISLGETLGIELRASYGLAFAFEGFLLLAALAFIREPKLSTPARPDLGL